MNRTLVYIALLIMFLMLCHADRQRHYSDSMASEALKKITDIKKDNEELKNKVTSILDKLNNADIITK